MAESKYFIDPLADKLGVTNVTSKRVLTVLVWNVIKSNCYIARSETHEAVKKKLMDGLMDNYLFSIMELVEYGQLVNLLCDVEKQIDRDTVYHDYIYPFVDQSGEMLGTMFER